MDKGSKPGDELKYEEVGLTGSLAGSHSVLTTPALLWLDSKPQIGLAPVALHITNPQREKI